MREDTHANKNETKWAKALQKSIVNYLITDQDSTEATRCMNGLSWGRCVGRLNEALLTMMSMVDRQPQQLKSISGVHVAHEPLTTLYDILRVLISPKEAMRLHGHEDHDGRATVNEPYRVDNGDVRLKIRIKTGGYVWLTMQCDDPGHRQTMQVLGQIITGQKIFADVQRESILVDNPGQHLMLFGLYRKLNDPVLDKVFKDYLPLWYQIVDCGEREGLDKMLSNREKLIAQLRLACLIAHMRKPSADKDELCLLDSYDEAALKKIDQSLHDFFEGIERCSPAGTIDARLGRLIKEEYEKLKQDAVKQTIELRKMLLDSHREFEKKCEALAKRATTHLQRQKDTEIRSLERRNCQLEAQLGLQTSAPKVLPDDGWSVWLGVVSLVVMKGRKGLCFSAAPLVLQYVLSSAWMRDNNAVSRHGSLSCRWLKSFQKACVVCLVAYCFHIFYEIAGEFRGAFNAEIWVSVLGKFTAPGKLWQEISYQGLMLGGWTLALFVLADRPQRLGMLWWPTMMLQSFVGPEALTESIRDKMMFVIRVVLASVLSVFTTAGLLSAVVRMFSMTVKMPKKSVWRNSMNFADQVREHIENVYEHCEQALLVLPVIPKMIVSCGIEVMALTVVGGFLCGSSIAGILLLAAVVRSNMMLLQAVCIGGYEIIPNLLRMHCFFAWGEKWKLLMRGCIREVLKKFYLRGLENRARENDRKWRQSSVHTGIDVVYFLGLVLIGCYAWWGQLKSIKRAVWLHVSGAIFQGAVVLKFRESSSISSSCKALILMPGMLCAPSIKLLNMYNRCIALLTCCTFFPGFESFKLFAVTMFQEVRHLFWGESLGSEVAKSILLVRAQNQFFSVQERALSGFVGDFEYRFQNDSISTIHALGLFSINLLVGTSRQAQDPSRSE